MHDLKSTRISQALAEQNALWNASCKHLEFGTLKIRGKASRHKNEWFALTSDKFRLKIKHPYLKEKVYNHLNSVASLLWSLPCSSSSRLVGELHTRFTQGNTPVLVMRNNKTWSELSLQSSEAFGSLSELKASHYKMTNHD